MRTTKGICFHGLHSASMCTPPRQARQRPPGRHSPISAQGMPMTRKTIQYTTLPVLGASPLIAAHAVVSPSLPEHQTPNKQPEFYAGKMHTIVVLSPLHSAHLALLLGETKVVATRRDGLDDLAAESLVAFVLGEIKFCSNGSQHTARLLGKGEEENLRLKQVCELGNLSLFP